MKSVKQILIFTIAIMTMALASCGDGGGNKDVETEKDLVLEALQGSWTLNASASSFGNTGIDGSDVSVTFTESGFTLGGEITSYASGGSYSVDEDGSITDAQITIIPDDVVLDGNPTVNLNAEKTQITIIFSTVQSEGRIDGLGDYIIVFTKD